MVSRHFHRVLISLIELEDQFLQQPNGTQTPPKLLHDSRFYTYFKVKISCVLYFTFDSHWLNIQLLFWDIMLVSRSYWGFDETYILVKVSNEDLPRYWARKGYVTQNVMVVAFLFDLKFTYVLLSWEWTGSNLLIISNALTKNDN